MIPSDLTTAVAAEQIRDQIRRASQSRLAAIARCCRPSAWARAARRAARQAAAPAGCCA
jgi:hypothetical protein